MDESQNPTAEVQDVPDDSDIVIPPDQGEAEVEVPQTNGDAGAEANGEEAQGEADQQPVEGEGETQMAGEGGGKVIPPNALKVFVGGISHETSTDDLKEYFTKLNFSVVDCAVIKEKETGRPRGFGFVTVEETDRKEELFKGPHNIKGRTVEVKGAIENETTKVFVGNLNPECTDGG
uniref:RRM domain-containing protein n=1 Tax=Chromera velia CCMP2878 TaxID=1169474 RepID=A0A0G4GU66_9ALVE|eukprot:Cvel_23396.t1-p1 / transcript=Cvel_23396.t1 / gene=Cvel_23396 / organism=Chromera_velia_CCMP2878 / gene_product=Heterogeneous nuclear ribonucleoprotein A/B, putative / transcript_product=Heterogeneous nuclear ribonucleoprotein A/B, putative / location=Cvel_scaffold2406:335-1485(-) / protein_length=176 / sequence_SO=supercontig / SO=protein_coding / is_pseudo=false